MSKKFLNISTNIYLPFYLSFFMTCSELWHYFYSEWFFLLLLFYVLCIVCVAVWQCVLTYQYLENMYDLYIIKRSKWNLSYVFITIKEHLSVIILLWSYLINLNNILEQTNINWKNNNNQTAFKALIKYLLDDHISLFFFNMAILMWECDLYEIMIKLHTVAILNPGFKAHRLTFFRRYSETLQ